MDNPQHPNSIAQWSQRLVPTTERTERLLRDVANDTASRGSAEPPSDSPDESPNQTPPPSSSAALPGERLLLSISRMAMACEFEVLLNQYQYPQGADRAIEALDLVEQLEARLSVYRPHSDLSLLNRFGSKRPIPLSSDTLTVLQLAQDIHAWTGGAFDITAGKLSEVWGFSRRQGAMPTAEQIAVALQQVGSQLVELDVAQRQARLLREGVQLNPGAIGKGYALDRVAQHLAAAEIGDYMLHGGLSSVVARGQRHHPLTGGGWLVSLRHPWRLEQVLGTIRLRDAALGTSGSGKQFFHFGGQRYSHIIDPRSGWPAQGVLSATVICRSGAIADALATALFVMGQAAAQQFCAEHPQIGAILVVASQRSDSPRIEAYNLTEEDWTAEQLPSSVR